ncbi:S49 family peptidase [Methylomonas rapida]|uniref:S49 family peptidase n=1 Tax=Methylomonas rapida TaxID=2963939 RepID=A0ABY7GFC5_9GAMM|nr:S49 family peptidase [Methylomonas rapida]WAR42926.1 S49 family peptidase [Methylomonas rapida]
MPLRNPALFARIFNTPLMIGAAKLDAIIAGIGPRFGIDAPQPDLFLTASGEFRRPGYQLVGNVAVIDVFGILAHRGSFDANCNYILGYDWLSKKIDIAINDPDVQGLLLQMDSPGGEVAGAFELAQQIQAAGQVKPIKAVISSLAASAGYLIASAAQDIAIAETGLAGSIGVVMRHVDVSKMAADQGISITHIFAGAQKIDGHQFAALPDDVKAKFQAEIDGLYTLFVDTVAAHRGLDVAAIRAQEAGIYRGQDAIQAGLADRIATPDQVLAEMQQSFSSSPGGRYMTTQKPEAAADAAALEQSRAAGFEAGKQDGLKAGAEQERARISAILNHEAAEGRQTQAKVLALDTDMTVEQAAKVLAVSPKEAAPAAQGDQFSQYMAKQKNPSVGADGGDEQPETAAATQGWHAAMGKVVALRGDKR